MILRKMVFCLFSFLINFQIKVTKPIPRFHFVIILMKSNFASYIVDLLSLIVVINLLNSVFSVAIWGQPGWPFIDLWLIYENYCCQFTIRSSTNPFFQGKAQTEEERTCSNNYPWSQLPWGGTYTIEVGYFLFEEIQKRRGGYLARRNK